MFDFYFIFLQKSRTESDSKKKLAETKLVKPESNETHSSRKSASKKVSYKPKVCEIISANRAENWMDLEKLV